MNAAPRVLLLMVMATAGVVSACAMRSGAGGRPGDVVVVLMPDADTGNVGRVVVSNAQGSTELASAWASTRVAMTETPQVLTLSESDVKRRFGDIIATLPPPPQHFVLPFQFDSEELTDEGRRLVQEVLKAVKNYPFPDIVVTGHTDTTGNAQTNVELGLRRANVVRSMLVQTGLSTLMIEVRSHGEAEQLVRTADNVSEPRNRRVEITVR